MGLFDRFKKREPTDNEYVKNFGDFIAYVPLKFKVEDWEETDRYRDVLKTKLNITGAKTFENCAYIGDSFLEVSSKLAGIEYGATGTTRKIEKKGEYIKTYAYLKVTYIPFSTQKEYKENKDKIKKLFEEDLKPDNNTYKIKHEKVNNAHVVMEIYNQGYSEYKKSYITCRNCYIAFPRIVEGSSKQSRNNKNIKKNFQYLDGLIRSGSKEIILDSDIILDKKENLYYSDGILLDADDMVIDGNGHTIDAKGKTRIFHSTGKNLKIRNIKLRNAFSSFGGGAILNVESGEITIDGCTFTNNTAKEEGGAILNQGKMNINGSTFSRNTARKDVFENGGAIANEGKMDITESTFSKNIATNRGGAIINQKELSISKSTLTENTARMDGGAIHNSGEMTISESSINSNTFSDGNFAKGGAIYNMGKMSIAGSSIDNNKIKGKNAKGAAIFNTTTSKRYGGYVKGTGIMSIIDSSINNNMIKGKDSMGGAILNDYDCDLNITNSIINNNTSKIGSSIFNAGNLTLKNTEIDKEIVSTESYLFNEEIIKPN